MIESIKNYFNNKIEDFRQTFWSKLKLEWKTAAVLVGATTVELYDMLVATNMDFYQIIPEDHRNQFHLGVLLLLFFLRKWTMKANVATNN